MADGPKLAFAPLAPPAKGVLVVFADEGVRFGGATRKALEPTGDLVARAAASERFTGKSGSALDIVAPARLKASRLIVIGIGKSGDLKDFVKLGGTAIGRIPATAGEATILLDFPGGSIKAEQAADVALGITLRAYAFERYRTRRKEGEEKPATARITLGVS